MEKINIIKKEFNSKPVHNEKYLKTKIQPYDGKINTNFYNNKIPKEVILIDSIYRKVYKTIYKTMLYCL